jgi:NADH-quinone oxidoreductase subunit A
MESLGAYEVLSPWEPGIFSLAVYGIMVFALIGVFLFVCAWPGDKKPSPEKAVPYECGILPTGLARFRYPVPFYLVAIFFLIFDVEAAYIFAWAVAFEPLGWSGWVRISFFILMLLLGLFYLWSKGELDWKIETSRQPKT